MKFYKVIAIPVFTYASETWTITGNEKQHTQTAEVNFLRHVSGYRLRDRTRNEHIMAEPGIFSINEKREEKKIAAVDGARLETEPPEATKARCRLQTGWQKIRG